MLLDSAFTSASSPALLLLPTPTPLLHHLLLFSLSLFLYLHSLPKSLPFNFPIFFALFLHLHSLPKFIFFFFPPLIIPFFISLFKVPFLFLLLLKSSFLYVNFFLFFCLPKTFLSHLPFLPVTEIIFYLPNYLFLFTPFPSSPQ